jgi:hypothetical protein
MLRHSSLVAGNVTGGGGKATTTKTYWHRALTSAPKMCKHIWDADRKRALRRGFSGYKKPANQACTCRICYPFENASAFSRGITNTLFLNLFRKQRICFLTFRLFANPKSKI